MIDSTVDGGAEGGCAVIPRRGVGAFLPRYGSLARKLPAWAAWAGPDRASAVWEFVEHFVSDYDDTPRGAALANGIRERVATALNFDLRLAQLGSTAIPTQLSEEATRRAGQGDDAGQIAGALVRSTSATAMEATAAALRAAPPEHEEDRAWVLRGADRAALQRLRALHLKLEQEPEGEEDEWWHHTPAAEQAESDRSRRLSRAYQGAARVLAELPVDEEFASALAARFDLSPKDAQSVAKIAVYRLLSGGLVAAPSDPDNPFSGCPVDAEPTVVDALAVERAKALRAHGAYQLTFVDDWQPTPDHVRREHMQSWSNRPAVRAQRESMIARGAEKKRARRARIDAYLSHRATRDSARVVINNTPRELPFDLESEPGLLGDVARWCSEMAFRPVPEFAQPAALAVLAALFGRRFATPTGLGLNLYIVGIAETGGGKDALVSAPRVLLSAAGLRHLVGPGDFTSDAAIEMAVRLRPSQVMCIDEFGKLAQAMTGRTAPSFAKLAAKALLELYPRSAPHAEWTGKQRAGDGRDSASEVVFSPTLSLVGVSTPAGFFEGMTESTLEDGMLNRLTLVVGGRPGARQRDPERLTPSTRLLDAMKAACEASSSPGNLTPSRAREASVPQNIRFVPWADAEAEAAIEAIEAWEDDARDHGRNGICGRAAEQTQKIATLRALARAPGAPSVQAEDVAWAWAFVHTSIQALERGAREHMASSAFEELVKAIEREVQKAGPKGLPYSRLLETKGVAKAEPRIVKAAIERLKERGVADMDIGTTARGGRPGQRIRPMLNGSNYDNFGKPSGKPN
jgi:hypothetical protein